MLERSDAADVDTCTAIVHTLAPYLQLRASAQGQHGAADACVPCTGSAACHVAAQCGVAAALAASRGEAWPACMGVLRGLLDASKVETLLDPDIRIYETPRGTLTVERFQAQLSPDELFAPGSLPVTVRAGGTDGGSAKRSGGRGAKGPAMSKEEVQRQAKLTAEVRADAVWRKRLHCERNRLRLYETVLT